MEHDPKTGNWAGEATPVTRRGFLFRLGVALSGVAGVILTVPVVGYVAGVLLRRKPYEAWISLGPVGDFPEKQTRLASYKNPFTTPWDGETANVPCWVRRMQGDTFQVFAINCTHLGCPVRWFPESGLFMCPCHGGVYYQDGARASGPPPRGLYVYQHRIQNGELWVRGGQLPTLSNTV
jgi:quinol---cytochrome c reductase iron-sulfur subunit, bacillus type